MPKALKSCPKSNKSPNLVTLIISFLEGACPIIALHKNWSFFWDISFKLLRQKSTLFWWKKYKLIECWTKNNYILHLYSRPKYDKIILYQQVSNLDKTFVQASTLWSSSRCYKTFFWKNLDFPKIRKVLIVCSDFCTCTKMWKQSYF